MSERPPDHVLRAFGVDGPPRPLPGGEGRSFSAGGLVLKPGAGPVLDWLADALADVHEDEFRLAAPVRSRDGTWSVAGWSATRWVDGSQPDLSAPSTWLDILGVGRALHRAVARLDRPTCLQARDDWWAVADRVAWGEQEVALGARFAGLGRRLRGALEPLGPSQVVHGDLTGNVLLSAALPPAVIDFSPYWRPPAYAEGVVVADALCWHGADASLMDRSGVPVPAVARALLFRLVTTSQAVASGSGGADADDCVRRYDDAAAAIGV